MGVPSPDREEEAIGKGVATALDRLHKETQGQGTEIQDFLQSIQSEQPKYKVPITTKLGEGRNVVDRTLEPLAHAATVAGRGIIDTARTVGDVAVRIPENIYGAATAARESTAYAARAAGDIVVNATTATREGITQIPDHVRNAATSIVRGIVEAQASDHIPRGESQDLARAIAASNGSNAGRGRR